MQAATAAQTEIATCADVLSLPHPHSSSHTPPLWHPPRPSAVEERVSVGVAEVKQVFGSGQRKVAGCLVLDGSMKRDLMAVVKRGKRVMHEVRGPACLPA